MQVLRYKLNTVYLKILLHHYENVFYLKKMGIEESAINRAIKRKGEVLCAYNKFVYNESSTTNQQ